MSGMGAAGEQQFCLRWNNHQANFIEVFEALLEEETFADVTLAVDGVIIKCHKMVLAACSAYFTKLFCDVPCSHPVVFLKDVKVSEVKSILEYVYKGEVNVARNDLAPMLKVAEMLQIKGLMNTGSQLPPVERHSSERHNKERPNEEAISTSTTSSHGTLAPEHGVGAPGGGGHSSPPHSTSSPYYGYGKSPNTRENRARFPLPVWALAQGLPLVGQNPTVVSAALHPSLAGRHSSIYGNFYENPTKASTAHNNRKNKISVGSMMRNHDTPILRGVLGQVHADSSQAAQHILTDVHELHYRSHSNGSADNGSDGRRSSMDLSNGHLAHSSYATGASMMDEVEKKPSRRSLSDDKKAAIANYVSSQKPEWKRYKQYTRADITDAIDAVRGGLSALQAARKFGVPSRTLYDKVKKLGITSSRSGRRSTNGSGVCFAYDVGSNVNGSIYGNISENDQDNGSGMVENPSAVLASCAESRDNSVDRETMMDQTRSPSPPLALCYQPPPHQQEKQQEERDQESDNEVEDLSVPRRPDVRVIMPPSVTIKEEA